MKNFAPLLLLITMLLPSAVSGLPDSQTVDLPRQTADETVVRRHVIKGSLAGQQTIGCLPLSAIAHTAIPPDLYAAVQSCIVQGEYHVAVGLFALAGLYGSFDSARVADKTAAEGITVLIMRTFADLSPEQKERFNATVQRVMTTPALLDALCVEIGKVGMPDYYPDYLLLHGLKAFTGDPHQEALIAHFNGPQVWDELQSTYLHCPAR
ncbi:MAG: hypothetical protein H7836_05520 [Magnetococcus sp. YQC-3]